MRCVSGGTWRTYKIPSSEVNLGYSGKHQSRPEGTIEIPLKVLKIFSSFIMQGLGTLARHYGVTYVVPLAPKRGEPLAVKSQLVRLSILGKIIDNISTFI